jgi:hypothetical protein
VVVRVDDLDVDEAYDEGGEDAEDDSQRDDGAPTRAAGCASRHEISVSGVGRPSAIAGVSRIPPGGDRLVGDARPRMEGRRGVVHERDARHEGVRDGGLSERVHRARPLEPASVPTIALSLSRRYVGA